MHCVEKIVISLIISVLQGQPIEPTPCQPRKHRHTKKKGMVLLQVTVFTTITKWQLTARRHYLERLVKGQLARTRVTHLYYPNFHRIRQYGVLIIPFSGKLNVILHKYITQHDIRSPSQHPDSWMENELTRNLQTSSPAAISPSQLGILEAFLKLYQFMVSQLVND